MSFLYFILLPDRKYVYKWSEGTFYIISNELHRLYRNNNLTKTSGSLNFYDIVVACQFKLKLKVMINAAASILIPAALFKRNPEKANIM